MVEVRDSRESQEADLAVLESLGASFVTVAAAGDRSGDLQSAEAVS
jgi:hypothetical protein